MNKIKLVATDLDGTFLRNDRTVSERNLNALRWLRSRNIISVAATGRNMKKVKEVLNDHTPFDYIVFSSGAGIYDWKGGKHLFNQNLSKTSSTRLLNYFIGENINFHAFRPVPENHLHWYFRGADDCDEFERYFTFNRSNATQLDPNRLPETELSQFLVIIKEDNQRFEKLKSRVESICPEIRVIRASSPITEGFIWIEVFHKTVSKGNGLKRICDMNRIDYTDTIGIGNDYNDFDLLDFTAHSYLTDNAPHEIRNFYRSAPSNEQDAFAVVIDKLKKKI